jgi:hypothetical protein
MTPSQNKKAANDYFDANLTHSLTDLLGMTSQAFIGLREEISHNAVPQNQAQADQQVAFTMMSPLKQILQIINEGEFQE